MMDGCFQVDPQEGQGGPGSERITIILSDYIKKVWTSGDL